VNKPYIMCHQNLPKCHQSHLSLLTILGTRCNPKVYNRNYDPVVLEKWVRRIEKIFTVVEVPEEKKANIGTYNLTSEVDIWWNIVKGRLVGLEFTWSKFLGELRAKFYPVVVEG